MEAEQILRIWNEKLQFCGTTKEGAFVGKCYESHSKTTVSKVFRVHMIIRKSFCFFNSPILDLKKASQPSKNHRIKQVGRALEINPVQTNPC